MTAARYRTTFVVGRALVNREMADRVFMPRSLSRVSGGVKPFPPTFFRGAPAIWCEVAFLAPVVTWPIFTYKVRVSRPAASHISSR